MEALAPCSFRSHESDSEAPPQFRNRFVRLEVPRFQIFSASCQDYFTHAIQGLATDSPTSHPPYRRWVPYAEAHPRNYAGPRGRAPARYFRRACLADWRLRRQWRNAGPPISETARADRWICTAASETRWEKRMAASRPAQPRGATYGCLPDRAARHETPRSARYSE